MTTFSFCILFTAKSTVLKRESIVVLNGNNGKVKVLKFYVMLTFPCLLLTHFPCQQRRTKLLRSPSLVICACVFLRLNFEKFDSLLQKSHELMPFQHTPKTYIFNLLRPAIAAWQTREHLKYEASMLTSRITSWYDLKNLEFRENPEENIFISLRGNAMQCHWQEAGKTHM